MTQDRARRAGRCRVLAAIAGALVLLLCLCGCLGVLAGGGLGFVIGLRSPRLVECALRMGADPDQGGLAGGTPLTDAVQRGDVQVAAVLLAHGADPNLHGWDDPAPPLHWAVLRRDGHMVRLLLGAGANPNPVDTPPQGMVDAGAPGYQQMVDCAPATPLHYAALQGDRVVVGELLRGGADSSVRDGKGKTSAERASQAGHHDLAVLLREAEAGRLPPSSACESGPAGGESQ